MRKIVALGIFSPGLLVLVADQIIKQFIRQHQMNRILFSLPGILDIMPCINTGAAFSMLSGHSALIALLSGLLLIVLVALIGHEIPPTPSRNAALSILCGAAAGNWLDRLRFGGVIDYLKLRFIRFPVFNFADICITLSIFYLAFRLLTVKSDKPSGA